MTHKAFHNTFVLVILLATCFNLSVGTFPTRYCEMNNRLRKQECFGRPDYHHKGYWHGSNAWEQEANLAPFGNGAIFCFDQTPDGCAPFQCDGARMDSADGNPNTWSWVDNELYMWLQNGPRHLKRFVITWKQGVNPIPFTLSLLDASKQIVANNTFNSQTPNNVYEFSAQSSHDVLGIKITYAGKVEVVELEGYEDPQEIQEQCPTTVQPPSIVGPVVAVVFEKSNLVDRFATIMWDSFSHIFFSAIKPSADVGVSELLQPCEEEYLLSLICWAHAKGVKILLSIKGNSADFQFAQNVEKRQQFVNNVINYAINNGLDGVDLFWAWPSNSVEGTLFSQILSDLFEVADGRILVTSNLPTEFIYYQSASAGFIPDSALSKANWFNVHAWNYVKYPPGGTNEVVDGVLTEARAIAHLDDVKKTMIYWNETRGLPKNRLVQGINFFGTSFSIYTGGEQSYRSIMYRYNNFPPSANQVGYIHYTGYEHTKNKAMWAFENMFGGVFAWEYNYDRLRGKYEIDYKYDFFRSRGRMSLLEAINTVIPNCGNKYVIGWDKNTKQWSPNYLEINENDKVNWNWRFGGVHNVIQLESGDPNSKALLDGFYSGPPADGDDWSYGMEISNLQTKIFNTEGTYYFKDEATGAIGTVIVKQSDLALNCTLPHVADITGPTPIDCEWGDWDVSESCTATCQNPSGAITYSRIESTVAQNNGKQCVGDKIKSEPCNVDVSSCPVDCVWGDWTVSESCTATCQNTNGIITYSRSEFTKEQNNGKPCDGDKTKSEPCNIDISTCPVDCQWGDWVDGNCSATCGKGTLKRERLEVVLAQNNGQPCTGPSSEDIDCYKTDCMVTYQWNFPVSDPSIPVQVDSLVSLVLSQNPEFLIQDQQINTIGDIASATVVFKPNESEMKPSNLISSNQHSYQPDQSSTFSISWLPYLGIGLLVALIIIILIIIIKKQKSQNFNQEKV